MINRKLLTLVLTIFSMTLLCTSLFGQNTRKQIDIAEISNSGSNVSFVIKVPYESATLTVSAPNGKVFRKVFKAGSVPNFAPINDRGEFYGNGKFTYELTLTPVLSAGVKEALAQSRIDGNSDEVAKDFRKRGMIPAPLVESGTFTFKGGTLITGSNLDKEPEQNTRTNDLNTKVTPKATKPNNAGTDVPTENMQTFVTDVIVQGSLCTGLDCVTSESFGFDTLRLKENNLRIHFQDTSASASFPSTDWRLVANETTNGGANKFSIEDATAGTTPFTVEGGAPTNSLYVDDGGRIGLRTATPVVEMHMVSGDTPTFRLEQDGSSGFTPQTWDVAGNESGFFVRDATNSSTLPFRILPNSSSESLVIASNGIGIKGDTTPGGLLDVNNGKLLVDTNGKLTTASSIQILSGSLIFPDGSTQTTASTGGGSGTASSLGSGFAQHILGGQGVVSSLSSITPTIDFNSFGFGTNGQAGVAIATYAIPYNLNLASQSATMVTYQIRYRDSDGVGADSQIVIELVGQDINTGGRSSDIIFSSNSNAGTGEQTVTVCRAFDTSNFNPAVRGMYINVTLQGTAAQSADFKHIRIYKGTSCP